MEQMQAWNDEVQVGKPAPSFAGVDDAGNDMEPILNADTFLVYLIDDRLPVTCADQQCGTGAWSVRLHGGHLVGGSEPKLAEAGFGVHMVPGRGLKFETSLLVIADKNRKIAAIYKNAHMADVPAIMQAWGPSLK